MKNLQKVFCGMMAMMTVVSTPSMCALPLAATGDIDAKVFPKTYEWSFRGEDFSVAHSFLQKDYYHYRKQRRSYEYGSFTAQFPGYRYLDAFVDKLAGLADEKGLTEWERVNFVVAFVQSLPYERDPVVEYPRYPIETLVENAGDCEDSAALLAALLDEMGYDVVMLSPPGHMAVGIACADCAGAYTTYNGKRYYYVETTGAGYAVGEVPGAYSGKSCAVYETRPTDGEKVALEMPASEGGPENGIEIATAEQDYGIVFEIRPDPAPEKVHTVTETEKYTVGNTTYTITTTTTYYKRTIVER